MEEPITTIQGFQAAGIAAGIKQSGNKDLALIFSDSECSAAAVFTQNTFAAAPVIVSKEHLAADPETIKAIIINSGNANACTGDEGLTNARTMTESIAIQFSIRPTQVLVASTGIIGNQLPVTAVTNSINQIASDLDPDGWLDAAEAIMTTDTEPKFASRVVKTPDSDFSLIGIAKGAGMIHPRMATLLGCVVTDAAITHEALGDALKFAVDGSFNRLTVDGDTSTNDTIFLLANGLAENPLITHETETFPTFKQELLILCQNLVQQLAADGEGATKMVEIIVKGAQSNSEASVIAEKVATSLLVKTAIFGNDPNWGRIVCAVGNSGISLDPSNITVTIGQYTVFRDGTPISFDSERLSKYLKEIKEVPILINIGTGSGKACFWTCDITYDYVKINADYHT
jgi:glutamate N-acetyltransferase/amino-acid N-acetyltransferase